MAAYDAPDEVVDGGYEVGLSVGDQIELVVQVFDEVVGALLLYERLAYDERFLQRLQVVELVQVGVEAGEVGALVGRGFD